MKLNMSFTRKPRTVLFTVLLSIKNLIKKFNLALILVYILVCELSNLATYFVWKRLLSSSKGKDIHAKWSIMLISKIYLSA